MKFDIKFASWLFVHLKPCMLFKEMAPGTFVMIPFDCILRNSSKWQYAFVNKAKKLYKMTFTSIDEFIDTLFDADEIWYGTEKHKNIFYNRKDEMLIQYDLMRHSTT